MLLRLYSFEKYKSKNFLFFRKNGAIIFAIFCGSEDPPHDPKIFFPVKNWKYPSNINIIKAVLK